jgi:hypothetical protein
MRPNIDWNVEAQNAVAYTKSQLGEAHRGAFFWDKRISIVTVFDNRKHVDPIRGHCPVSVLLVTA